LQQFAIVIWFSMVFKYFIVEISQFYLIKSTTASRLFFSFLLPRKYYKK